jgi:hypothetical protein
VYSKEGVLENAIGAVLIKAAPPRTRLPLPPPGREGGGGGTRREGGGGERGPPGLPGYVLPLLLLSLLFDTVH